MHDRRNLLTSIAALPLAGAATQLPGASSSPSSAFATAISIFDFLPSGQLAAIKSGRSELDCAPAIRAAIAQTRGGPLYFPAGNYLIGSSLKLLTAATPTAFGPGPWIIGDGIGRTMFDNRATNGAMFDVDSNVDHSARFSGVLGVRFEGFTIGSRVRGVPTSALRLRTAYMARLFQLHIIGQGGDGIRIPCTVGDNDGSNMISLEQVRIENCGGWGLDTAGDPGFNENSCIKMQQVFVQGCGTASANEIPPSGGMRHKGQILALDQCAFTINENVALYIPGQAGLAQTVDIAGTAFENNHKRHLLCTGVSGFKARNIQFYNNDGNSAQVACEFSGAQNTVRYVQIDGVSVRATAGNRITAFRFSGANLEPDSCRIRNVVWENFDYPGQTRFDGVPFDPIPMQGDLVVTDGQTLLYRPSKRGNKVPLRLRGKGSSSGEWVAASLPDNGVYASNAGLRANAHYDVYLWDNNGVKAIDMAQSAPIRDAKSGYAVKPGDASRLHIGAVMTDASGNFARTGTGWLNPVLVPGNAPGRYTRIWTDASGRLRMVLDVDPRSDGDGTIIG